MIQFEDILQNLVDSMDGIQINPSLFKRPRFYWGIQTDLPAFLAVYKEDGFPLIWLVTKVDKKVSDGYSREVEICFCTRETRELLNTKRMEASYKTVLIPLWEAFERKIRLSQKIMIIRNTQTFLKAPNFSVSEKKKENPVLDIWDVYKVTFKANYTEY